MNCAGPGSRGGRSACHSQSHGQQQRVRRSLIGFDPHTRFDVAEIHAVGDATMLVEEHCGEITHEDALAASCAFVVVVRHRSVVSFFLCFESS